MTTIIVFNLRGNCRTSGETRRKEGGNVFGLGSRTPIAITILVKSPGKTGQASIFYHDIGDYIPQTDKLKLIKELGSICNPAMELSSITPNEGGDWINQRNDLFKTFTASFDDKNRKSLWAIKPIGVATNRDSWVYSFRHDILEKNINRTIEFYNSQVDKYQTEGQGRDVEDVVEADPNIIKWTRGLRNDARRGKKFGFDARKIAVALYRPFTKQYLYNDASLIECPGIFDRIFPTPQTRNLVICCSGIGVTKEFSCIITDIIPDLELIGKSQCFPLYYYEKQDKQRQGEFDFGDGQKNEDDNIRRDGISDFILKRCKELNPKISKEDIFYYVYGLLHSPDYRQRFSADLKKSLPHIPLPEEYALFKAFQTIGRKLADIHLNYETYPMCQDVLVQGENSGNFHVEKMRFISKEDKRTIIFNDCIQIENVPLKAYEYVLNGKSAIEWIMERYAITTDKASGIVNDPNQWSDNPRYILELLLRIIQVSVDTVDLVAQLPHWEF